MVATRTGQHAQQQALEDMPGVDVKRKAGGSKRADGKPQQERPLKRTKAGGRSGKKAAAAADARKSTAQEQGQDTAADDARAAAAAVDTGEDPQQKLQKDTKQTGLKAEGGFDNAKPHDDKADGSGGSDDGNQGDAKAENGSDGDVKPNTDGRGGSGDGTSHDDKADSGTAKDVKLDRSDHGNAKPAGAKHGGASDKGNETRAAKVCVSSVMNCRCMKMSYMCACRPGIICLRRGCGMAS
jgi:hypothetical protein